MSTTFFNKRRKSFYIRAYTPRKIRGLLRNRIELWRSLDTADRDEASLRAAQWESRIKRVFVTLKKDGRYMTQAQIDALVEHWLESELDEADDFRAIEGPFSDEDRGTKSLILSDQWEESNEALVSCNYRKVEREADALLKAAGRGDPYTLGADQTAWGCRLIGSRWAAGGKWLAAHLAQT